MEHENDQSLFETIKNCLSNEELQIFTFACIPNIFTEDMLAWCMKEQLQYVKTTITSLMYYKFINAHYTTTAFVFYTIHDRLRNLIIQSSDHKNYIHSCEILIKYYDFYMQTDSSVLGKQFYNDKLFCQLVMNKNYEWRCSYQSALERGDLFMCGNLLDIYKKSLQHNNKSEHRTWYQYYLLQNTFERNKILTSDEFQKLYNYTHSTSFKTEQGAYWHNLLGVVLSTKGKYQQAQKSFYRALKWAETPNASNSIKYNLCVVYIYCQNYRKAQNILCSMNNIEDNSKNLFIYIKFKLLQAIIEKSLYNLEEAIIQLENILKLQTSYQRQISMPQNSFLPQVEPSPLYISLNKDIYNYMGDIYVIQGDFKTAIESHKLGLRCKEMYEDTYGMAWAHCDLGKIYYLSGDIKKSKDHLQLSRKLFLKTDNKFSQAYPLMELSYVFQYEGKTKRAIQVIKKSIDLHNKLGSRNNVLNGLNTLGRLYQSQGYLHVAHQLFEFCLCNLNMDSFQQQIKGWTLNNLARNYLYSKDYAIALAHFKTALNIFNEINEKRGFAYVQNNIAEVYAQLGKYEYALELFLKSNVTKKEMGDLHGICYTYRELGELHIKLGKYDIARNYIGTADELCRFGNFVMLKGDISISYGNYYKEIQEYELADKYYHEALENYISQNFYGRSINCVKIIEKMYQEHYNSKNLHPQLPLYFKNIESKETLLSQEIQELILNTSVILN